MSDGRGVTGPRASAPGAQLAAPRSPACRARVIGRRNREAGSVRRITMLDAYTKVVLTVIAVALLAIAVRPLFEIRQASALGNGCGSIIDPCYVTSRGPLDVRVK